MRLKGFGKHAGGVVAATLAVRAGFSRGSLRRRWRGSPQAVIAEQRSEQREHLAQDRDHGELVLLAVRPQAHIDRLQCGFQRIAEMASM